MDVTRIHIQDELGRRLAVTCDLRDGVYPPDLHPVIGDLRPGIHHQTRTSGQHRQLRLGRELPAKLQVYQGNYEREDQH
ncbi:Uncharacterised protein [Mycobacterium tuberculosis]|nr:Uncharacterised protein [Mycobacterium tuberculosis]